MATRLKRFRMRGGGIMPVVSVTEWPHVPGQGYRSQRAQERVLRISTQPTSVH